MKISTNHIRYYQQKYQWSGEPMPDGIDALAQKIGAQLGAIEEIIDDGSVYDGDIIIVRVVSCEQHPNADRLHVCKVDDGGKAANVTRDEQGYVQVVCGAPNVRAGMLAVWLAPGVTVPSTVGKEPFVLEARELRGQMSNGMMASPKELGLGDNHEGILEVDGDAAPGTLFAEYYDYAGDYIIDIENKMFTHRPDCFGMMGVAREIAGIQGQAFKSPDWYTMLPVFPAASTLALPLEVRNELPDLVPRFTAIAMSNIQIAPSPVWLQTRLNRLGVRPINNVVDLTNYFMILTGQPLHAYDYDKVCAQDAQSTVATLVVRKPKQGEKITLLNGKEVEPRSEAIMIATRDRAIGIGGVMGGGETEVDETTKNIIIECATFDMYSIRRTSMAHGLFTDAVTRFNKGQSPLQNLAVLAKIVDDVTQVVGGKVASAVIDDNHLPQEAMDRGSLYAPVSVTAQFVNERLGLNLSADEVATLLRNVEFKVDLQDDGLTITAPFWRTDIELSEDIVEEVGRLYGFDHLPLELPLRSLEPAHRNRPLEVKARIRQTLSRAGANEVLTYSFVHGNLLDKVGQDKTAAFRLANALSPDLQYYRLSLTPSLLERVRSNIKAGYDEFALFEMGKIHEMTAGEDDGLPMEFDNLALVYAAKDSAKSGAAFYEARAYLEYIAKEFGMQLEYAAVPNHVWSTDAPFDLSRSALVKIKGEDTAFGVIGELKADVLAALKLPAKTAAFEVGIMPMANAPQLLAAYTPLPKFPKVSQDICLKVTADTPYQQVFALVQQTLAKTVPQQSLTDLAPVDIYQRPDDTAHKQITLRISVASYDRTLTDAEVAHVLDDIASSAQETLHAERI